MYLPDDIWHEIKRYMFKSIEMKKYDKFVKYFNKKITFVNNLKFKNEPYEQMLYDSWSFAGKFIFIHEVFPKLI